MIEAVAAVVLISQQVELVRPHEVDVDVLVTDPGSRPEQPSRLVPGNVLLLFDAEDQRDVVAPGLDLSPGREQRETAGGAGCFVPHGGDAGKCRLHRGGHRTQLALAVEQLAEGVADVQGLDAVGRCPRVDEGVPHDVGEQVRHVQALAGVVAGEVGLGAAQDEERHALTFFFLGSGTNALVVSM